MQVTISLDADLNAANPDRVAYLIELEDRSLGENFAFDNLERSGEVLMRNQVDSAWLGKRDKVIKMHMGASLSFQAKGNVH